MDNFCALKRLIELETYMFNLTSQVMIDKLIEERDFLETLIYAK